MRTSQSGLRSPKSYRRNLRRKVLATVLRAASVRQLESWAAYRAQDDALEIEAQAKCGLADEYDAAQERGEVARIGDNLPSVPSQNAKPTAADLGIPRKEIHEARIIRANGAVIANPVLAPASLHELLHRKWHLVVLGKAPSQLVGDIYRHVARPSLGGVEGDDARGMAILAFHQVTDQRLAVGVLFIGLPPSAA